MADEDKQEGAAAEQPQEQQPGPEAPEQQTEQSEDDLSALGPHVPQGESEPEPVESSGDSVTATEPLTDDDLQGD